MQKQYEEQYHRVESDHWWFVGRRQIVHRLVVAATGRRDCRILEIGCSGGVLMSELRREGFEQVSGIDISPRAIDVCRRAGLDARIMDAQNLAFPDSCFDLITASDILEHLPDEGGALREWHRVLKPAGLLVVFVPAFMLLWSVHDVANKHFRRYRRHQLRRRLGECGFCVERSSYWNALAFPGVALIRGGRRLCRRGPPSDDGGKGDLFVPPVLVNRAMLALLRLENCLFHWGVNWPWGVSVMALARKPAGQGVSL